MARTRYTSVDEYMRAQPQAVQHVLGRVRAAIRAALPRAEEVISYQIPAYKQDGGTVIFFAGWMEHYSLYPVSERLVAGLGKDVAPYTFSKGTMRLPIGEPVPEKLIARIAKQRVKELTEVQKAKAVAKTAKRKAK